MPSPESPAKRTMTFSLSTERVTAAAGTAGSW
jgi:hypothetical protein